MVYFVCDGCSETLKKNQVDAHAARCRNCASVCCVDCNVSFFGDDYRSHTSCITESERYEGKFAKKPKKRNPQEEWMDIVQTCAAASSSTLPPNLKYYFETLSTLDNIPRKQKQFNNFASNSLNLRRGNGDEKIQEIWNILQKERDRRQSEKEAAAAASVKSNNQNTIKNKDMKVDGEKKEQNGDDNSSDDENDDDNDTSEKEPTKEVVVNMDPDHIKKTIKKVLKKAPKQSMKKKELRKVLHVKLGLNKKHHRKQLKKMLEEGHSTYFNNKKGSIKVNGKIFSIAKKKE